MPRPLPPPLHNPPPPPRALLTHPRPPPPRRLTQAPALAPGGNESQALPKTAAAIAAPDHFPIPWRKRRRSSSSLPSSVPVVSLEVSSFISKKVDSWLCPFFCSRAARHR